MRLGIAAGLAAGALWGLVFVAPRMLPQASAVDLVNGRFIAYGLVALAVVLVLRYLRGHRGAWPNSDQFLHACVLSVLGCGGYYALLALGIQWAGTELPSLIIGTIPLALMVLGRPPGLAWRRLMPGLALTALGVAAMAWAGHGQPQEIQTLQAAPRFAPGIALAVCAMACWTAFALLNARYLRQHAEVNATDWANWLGLATGCISGLGAAVWWGLHGVPEAFLTPFSPSVSGFVAFFALRFIATGFGSTWLATVLWNIASQRLSASLCGQLIVGETLFALIYSFAWDGRWPSGLQMLAAGLFVVGVVLGVRAQAKSGLMREVPMRRAESWSQSLFCHTSPVH
jgi:drug/metabolite transporter (DMT)-like permease